MSSQRARGSLYAIVICSLLLTQACGSDSPVTPTPQSVTLTSVSISGASGTPSMGDHATLKATANFSDGSSQDVTAQAVWDSSNRAVADVSSGGSLTIVAAGVADIRATYNNVSGVLHLTIAAAARPILRGTVTDADNGQPLTGVSVQVLDGANSGRSTQTDGSGSYTLDNLVAGSFTVQFSKASYTTATRGMTLSTDARIDLSLTPVAPDVSGFYGAFNITLTVTHQNCGQFPVFPGPPGTLELSGRPDGTGFFAKLTERGVSRIYNGGRMNTNGTFGGFFSGLVPGFLSRVVPLHDASGNIQGTVSGRNISGTEALTYGDPCPGGTISISFSGSR